MAQFRIHASVSDDQFRSAFKTAAAMFLLDPAPGINYTSLRQLFDRYSGNFHRAVTLEQYLFRVMNSDFHAFEKFLQPHK